MTSGTERRVIVKIKANKRGSKDSHDLEAHETREEQEPGQIRM